MLMVSALAALMAAMMVVMSGPAMANHLDFNGDDDDDLEDFFFFGDDDLEDFFGFGNGFDSDLDQESESGDLETNFSVENTGDYAFQCTPALQFGNTGNFNQGSTFVQGFSELDDFEPEGIEVGFGGGQSTDCSNTIQQSSAASS